MSVDGTTAATFGPGEGFVLDRPEWEARAARLREAATADGVPEPELAEALASFELGDAAGRTWTYDGSRWTALDGGPGDGPTGRLTLRPFSFELVPASGAAEVGIAPTVLDAFDDIELDGLQEHLDEASAGSRRAPYRPTHLVPVSGLPTWSRPDPALHPDNQLDPGLDVMVLEWRADGWAHIETSNTWTAWIDGRLLDPLPAAGAPDRPS
jgi:hypothetical protein